MFTRRRLFFSTVAASLSGAAAVRAQPVAERHFVIGAGPIGGTYFPVAGLIATAISNPPGGRPCEAGGNCGVPGLVADVLATQGSVENLRKIADGGMESGLAQADVALAAYKGEDTFTGRALTNLRAMANLFPETVHVVVRRGTGLETIADLRGRIVSLGERESGALSISQRLLLAFGIGRRDIDALYLSPQAASTRLREGTIDAFIMIAGQPAPLLTAMALQSPIDLLPVPTAIVEKMRESQPYITEATVATGLYDGIDARPSFQVNAHWLVAERVEADIVYGNLRALFHPAVRGRLDRGLPSTAAIRLETAIDGLTVPLHEGATRFYKERGLIKE
ncbi:TAXI family TRAP transporter solute-binding subunit [Reyranella sp. CPCC 100927]|uniref:TAXI family TRAP transporter solute-binding subunit n=1 Tax=Reyranella sp. CPCC 100927 TaxID=2599616 RepID=UPI0015B4B5B1|nr:TAXI family TRAP transporter solute-binding subunit [Reyranella sp. CPCC 100927]